MCLNSNDLVKNIRTVRVLYRYLNIVCKSFASDRWSLKHLLTYLLEPMHLNVEGLRPWDWSYPVLQYLREWPTPTVIIFDMAL